MATVLRGSGEEGKREVFVDTEHCNINSFQGMNLRHILLGKNENKTT